MAISHSFRRASVFLTKLISRGADMRDGFNCYMIDYGNFLTLVL